MPFRIGPWEIGLIVIIILIVFGVGKLPQVGGAIGKGIRAFKKGQIGDDSEGEETVNQPPKKASPKKASPKKASPKKASSKKASPKKPVKS